MDYPVYIAGRPVKTAEPRPVELPYDGSVVGTIYQAGKKQVHVGGFLINEVPQCRVDQMPYGGVKLSGTGREGPKCAIEEMTEPRLICWKV